MIDQVREEKINGRVDFYLGLLMNKTGHWFEISCRGRRNSTRLEILNRLENTLKLMGFNVERRPRYLRIVEKKEPNVGFIPVSKYTGTNLKGLRANQVIIDDLIDSVAGVKDVFARNWANYTTGNPMRQGRNS